MSSTSPVDTFKLLPHSLSKEAKSFAPPRPLLSFQQPETPSPSMELVTIDEITPMEVSHPESEMQLVPIPEETCEEPIEFDWESEMSEMMDLTTKLQSEFTSHQEELEEYMCRSIL